MPTATTDPELTSHAGKPETRWMAWTVAGLTLASLPALLFPGDAPFINDEPLLILAALKANAAHTLATGGLHGTRGMIYGPLPTWIYQLLLAATHEPLTLVLVHAALLALGTLLALVLLARSTGLWSPFAVVITLSPVLWFQERQLWDNTFNIPLCALVLAAYAHFLARRSPLALAGTVAGLAIAPFIHLMAVAFVFPVALHMVILERRALLRYAPMLLPVPVVLVVLSWPYLQLVWSSLSAAADTVPQATSGMGGWLFPLLGAKFLSAWAYHVTGAEGALTRGARLVSVAAFPLVWGGMLLTLWRLWSLLRGRRSAEVRDHLAGLALAIVGAQSLLDGVMRTPPHTHYLNATWIAYAVLAWLLVDALVRARSPWLRALGLLGPLHGAALAIVSVAMIAAAHAAPGTLYGATIANQVEVAREIARYPQDTPVTSDVYPYREYPHALQAMKALVGPQPAAATPAGRLVIRISPADPAGGWAVVVPE